MLQLLKSKFPNLDKRRLLKVQPSFKYGTYAVTVRLHRRGMSLPILVMRDPAHYWRYDWMKSDITAQGNVTTGDHTWFKDSLPRELLRQFYHYLSEDANGIKLKHRLELDHVAVYFQSVADAEPFISWLVQSEQAFKIDDLIEEISAVADCQTHGEIAVRHKNLAHYQYRITLDSFDCSKDRQNAIGKTFENFADSVKLTGSVNRLVNRSKDRWGSSNWWWGGYFYAKDEAVITYLSLSWPGLIKKIHRVKYIGK